MRKTVAVLAGFSVLFASAGVAGAAEYAGLPLEPGGPEITLTPGEGVAGSLFEVSGDDCDGTVELEVFDEYVDDEDGFRTVPTDDGSWSTEFRVLDDVGPDTQIRIQADCRSNGIPANVQGFRGDPGFLFAYEDAYFDVIADRTLTLTPDAGPAGSSFEVSGTTCTARYADEEITVSAGDTDKTVTPGSVGEWSTTFTVPADAVVGSTIDIDATCTISNIRMNFRSAPTGDTPTDTFDYETAVFTVTGTDATPSSSTPASSTTTADGAVAAVAATPTTARPTFTG